MLRKRILIEISPHRFDAAIVCGGQVIARCDASSHFTADAESLDSLLDRAKPKLVAFASSHSLKGAKATVLYSSSSASFGVFSCPVSTGMSKALDAAALALEEAADFPLADNPHSTTRLCTDTRQPSPDRPGSQMIHVFGLAESDAVAAQICQWVHDCGLRVQVIMPARAVSMLAAVEAAMTPASQYTRIVLHMSDDNTVLAAARNGSLRFVRTIGADASAFVNALTGDIKTSGAAGSTVRLTRSQAAALLFREGIPQSGREVDPAMGISANDVLPLLQPILQRCVIETKQSIRFGLTLDERDNALFAVTGVGARIPGLAELIARQTSIELDDGMSHDDGTGSSLESYAALTDPPSGIVSVSVRSHRRSRRLQIALAMGLCAGMLFLGTDAAMTHVKIKNSQLASQALEHRLASTRPVQQASQRLIHSEALLARTDRTFAHVTRGRAQWDAVLALFSMTASENVTFSRIHMSQDAGRPTCSLSGEIRADSEQDARNEFASLIAALSNTPIVEHCSIASTVKDRTNPGVQRFELRLALRESIRSTIVLALDDAHPNARSGGRP
ncbi:MAG: hypothetical protein IIB04_03550 [Acidobacteria bacterium]|nr:hypothetical protein [Acidobacteriota bacterium]